MSLYLHIILAMNKVLTADTIAIETFGLEGGTGNFNQGVSSSGNPPWSHYEANFPKDGNETFVGRLANEADAIVHEWDLEATPEAPIGFLAAEGLQRESI